MALNSGCLGPGLCPVSEVMDLRGVEVAGSAVQGIILRPGDCLFDAGKVIAKQFLGVSAGDVRSSAIDQRHGNLCGRERAGGSSDIFRDGHRSSSYRYFLLDLAPEPGAARVLLSPFWTGAAHIVQLGPKGIE
jgi:hypothetical protein